MSKKIIRAVALCSTALFISACSLNTPFKTQHVAGARASIQPQTEEFVDESVATNQQMKSFFAKFLKVSHEDLLVLNQKPREVNDEYWRAYKAYETKVNDILGEYLSSEAKAKLSNQYLHDDFQFPRFVELNDYMITDIANVSDAKIVSKQVKEDSIVYEVEVIAMANVIDLDWANKKYTWDGEKGYYIQSIFLDTGVDADEEPGLDRIRVAMNYFVEIPDGETFTVNSVREKTGLYLGMDEQANIKNNQFITRRSFLNAVIVKEEAVIHDFLDEFLKEDYNFYSYYRKAYDTDFETFRILFEDYLNLSDIVALDEENYKRQFEPSIIPLKDNMESLYFDVIEDVVVMPHVSSSSKLSTYQVVINADVRLINGQVVPYEYTYLIILDKELRISSMRLMTQQELDPEEIAGQGVTVEEASEENDLDLEEEQ